MCQRRKARKPITHARHRPHNDFIGYLINDKSCHQLGQHPLEDSRWQPLFPRGLFFCSLVCVCVFTPFSLLFQPVRSFTAEFELKTAGRYWSQSILYAYLIREPLKCFKLLLCLLRFDEWLMTEHLMRYWANRLWIQHIGHFVCVCVQLCVGVWTTGWCYMHTLTHKYANPYKYILWFFFLSFSVILLLDKQPLLMHWKHFRGN